MKHRLALLMGIQQLWKHTSGLFKRLQLLLNGSQLTLKHFSDWLVCDDERLAGRC
jgi:hypothetical protein